MANHRRPESLPDDALGFHVGRRPVPVPLEPEIPRTTAQNTTPPPLPDGVEGHKLGASKK